MKSDNIINIRPNVSMLSVLKYLEYEPWFALAEFVDNSIASYQANESALKELHGKEYLLEVSVEIDECENKITIRDNAAGIDENNYFRAFRAADIPIDTSGLSEFGMGMKSASCWFSDLWRVRTTAIGESTEKTVEFDMKKIIESKIEELKFDSVPTDKNNHYTVIELYDVHKIPRKKGLGKVKSHLASIYREFIRKGLLKLKVDNTELKYDEPKILQVPKYNDLNGESILWKKEIDFPIEDNLSIHGFVAIREKASTAEAGFALFRRGRVIEGSFDNGFRPDYIFGASNSFRYQRVFGELHLEGFDVSFTKKGIQWDENLDIFLRLLKDDISSKAFPLLQQAELYRVRASENEYKSTKKMLDETVDDIEKEVPKVVDLLLNNKNLFVETKHEYLVKTEKTIRKEFEIRFNKVNWRISIELSYDPSLNELIEIGDRFINDKEENGSIRQIGIRLSLTHSFMVEFVGIDASKIEPILRIVAAFGLSEIIAKESGVKTQGEVRRNFNEIITYLSKEKKINE